MVALRQELRGFRQAVRCHCQLFDLFVSIACLQGVLEGLLQVGKIRRQKIADGPRWIDEAAENGRFGERLMQRDHAGFSTRIAARQRHPVRPLAGHRLAAPRKPQTGQRPEAAGAWVAPGFQSQREGCDCHAAPVQLQAVQVVSQHGVYCLGRRQVLKRHAHGHQSQEGGNEEVP